MKRKLLVPTLFLCSSLFAQLPRVYPLDSLNVLMNNTLHPEVHAERLLAQQTHASINRHREQKQLSQLQWNDTLWLAARNHAVYLLLNNLTGHTQQAGKQAFNGQQPEDRIAFLVGETPNYRMEGENVYSQSGFTLESMPNNSVESWLNSPGHKANMERNYNQHGLAIAEYGGQQVAVDLFISGVVNSAPLARKSGGQLNQSQLMVSEPLYARESIPNSQQKAAEKPLSTTRLKKELAGIFYYLKVKEIMPANTKKQEELSKRAEQFNLSQLSAFGRSKEYRERLKEQSFQIDENTEAVAGNLWQQIVGKTKSRRAHIMISFPEKLYSPEKIQTVVFSYWKTAIQELEKPIKHYGYHVACRKKGNSFLVSATLQAM